MVIVVMLVMLAGNSSNAGNAGNMHVQQVCVKKANPDRSSS